MASDRDGAATSAAVLKKLAQLDARERKLERQEQTALTLDREILANMTSTEKELGSVSSLYRYRLIISLLVTVALVLVWYGIDKLVVQIPFISTGLGALLVGLILLLVLNRFSRTRS